MSNYTAKNPKKVIQINHEELRGHLNSIVTDTVEEVLNKVLDSEAQEMVGADRYQRSATARIIAVEATQANSRPGRGK